jgi:cation transport ATPase
MFENFAGASAQLEQYRLAMRIISLWEKWRMTIIWIVAALFLVAVLLFIFKKAGHVFFLVFSIILGLATIGIDFGMTRLKKYVEKRKKEAVREAVTSLPEKIIELLPEKATKTVTEPVKKVLPFGRK